MIRLAIIVYQRGLLESCREKHIFMKKKKKQTNWKKTEKRNDEFCFWSEIGWTETESKEREEKEKEKNTNNDNANNNKNHESWCHDAINAKG